MQSFVYIAPLLAAYSAASPAQVQRPGLSGYSSQHHEQQEQSSSASSYRAGGYENGFDGVGGFGLAGYGSSSQYSQQSSASYSSSMVLDNFSAISSRISQIQTLFSSGSFNEQAVIQQMSQLASSFQIALSQAPQCSSCFAHSDFSSSVSSVFQEFTQLMSYMQTIFRSSFSQICAPFGGLESSFQSFFHSISSSGVPLQAIIPQSFPNVMGSAIPNLSSTLSKLGFE